MDKRHFNSRLNGLKDAYPSELALIEGIQDLFNKKIEVISKSNAHALLQYPAQFTRPLSTSRGEWTTQLHIWADNMVPQLISIDPLFLSTKDSMGSTVLHSMVMAATGRFTQMIDYDYIQSMLDKNMSYIYMSIPNDPSSKTEGNTWTEKDPTGKTPMDYLIDVANGEDGTMPDERLGAMLDQFASTPEAEPPVDNTPDIQGFDPATGAPITQDTPAPGAEDQNGPVADPTEPLPDENQLQDGDTTTTMAGADEKTDNPGTPTPETATDNQERQVEQAKSEMADKPTAMLESLFRLFA